jgi:cell division protein FtsB
MGRLLTITATGQTRLGSRKRTLTGLSLRTGPVTVQLVIIVAGTLLGMFYLIQSNRVSTQNLQLKALEAQKTEIAEENERLSTEASRLQSIQQIKKAAEEQKLQEKARADAFAG